MGNNRERMLPAGRPAPIPPRAAAAATGTDPGRAPLPRTGADSRPRHGAATAPVADPGRAPPRPLPPAPAPALSPQPR
jgi:hypothetical protein